MLYFGGSGCKDTGDWVCEFEDLCHKEEEEEVLEEPETEKMETEEIKQDDDRIDEVGSNLENSMYIHTTEMSENRFKHNILYENRPLKQSASQLSIKIE